MTSAPLTPTQRRRLAAFLCGEATLTSTEAEAIARALGYSPTVPWTHPNEEITLLVRLADHDELTKGIRR